MISLFSVAQAASSVPAAPVAGAPAVDWTRALIQLGAIILIFYFLFIRPQQKRAKEHAQMLNNLKVGDEVLVAGMIGKVAKLINEAEVSVELADGVKVKVLRAYIGQVLIEAADNKTKKVKE